MAYDTAIPAGGHGNFVTPNLAHEGEGCRVDFLTVDYINTMAGARLNHASPVCQFIAPSAKISPVPR
jgi:hypothetical protein